MIIDFSTNYVIIILALGGIEMKQHRLELEIPDTVFGFMQMDDEKIKIRLYKLLLADLARQGIISFGKAAELAGVDKMAFITEMGHMGIPYFGGDISEVLSDAETVEQTMAGVAQ